MTFSSAVSAGSSWNDWKTNPSCCCRSDARASSDRPPSAVVPSHTSPAVGRSSPARSPSSVVLPEARRAHDGDRPARFDLEAHPVEDGQRRVTAQHYLGERLGANGGTRHGLQCRWDRTIRKDKTACTASVPCCFASGTNVRWIAALPLYLRSPIRFCAERANPPTMHANEHDLPPRDLPCPPVRRACAAGLARRQRCDPSVILIVGDSVSAAYGLAPTSGWATLLQQRLAAQHFPHQVVNASISGDTTANGRARLDALLMQHRPAITVIELGGNDGLRGGSLDAMRANLDAMTTAAQKAGSRVLLRRHARAAELRRGCTRDFAAAYNDVAERHKCRWSVLLRRLCRRHEPLFQPIACIRPRQRQTSCSTTCGRSCRRCSAARINSVSANERRMSFANEQMSGTRASGRQERHGRPHSRTIPTGSTCAVRSSTRTIMCRARKAIPCSTTTSVRASARCTASRRSRRARRVPR